jgi:hypothetical protein
MFSLEQWEIFWQEPSRLVLTCRPAACHSAYQAEAQPADNRSQQWIAQRSGIRAQQGVNLPLLASCCLLTEAEGKHAERHQSSQRRLSKDGQCNPPGILANGGNATYGTPDADGGSLLAAVVGCLSGCAAATRLPRYYLRAKRGHSSHTGVLGCYPRATRKEKPVSREFKRRRDGVFAPLSSDQFRAKFWSKVVPRETGCWEWTGHTLANGYGRIGWNHRGYSCHRLAYQFAFGDPGELMVCHVCDNRKCCNPLHLFLGDHTANMADAKRKGRTLQGERNLSAKLTEETVRKIRSRDPSLGRTQIEIASRLGIAQGTVSAIRKRKIWKHVRA